VPDVRGLTPLQKLGVDLLDELAQLGFARRHVARLVGVDVPTLAQWRGVRHESREPMSPDDLDKLAALLDVCTLVRNTSFVPDVAAFFETPLLPNAPIRPMDLYAAGRVDLLLDWASRTVQDPAALLSTFDPNWRERYHSEYEVFEATDGDLAIRAKEHRPA
jgi:transcriptional regulator with XRE-family HTH domain